MIKKIIIILGGLAIIIAGVFLMKKISNKTTFWSENPKVSSADEIHPFGFTSISKEEAEVAKEVGDTIVRASISWSQIEPKEGKFNFDKFKGAGQNTQFLTMIRFKTGQNWATKCNLSLCKTGMECPSSQADCPPKDLGGWSEKGYSPLLYDLVYKTMEFASTKRITTSKIILGNEVNDAHFWLGTNEDYLKTRTTFYKAIQDVNKKYNTQFQLIDNGYADAVWSYAISREAFCNGRQDYAKSYAERAFRRIAPVQTIDSQLQGTDCNKTYDSNKILDAAFAVDPNLGKPSFDYMSYHFYEPWDVQEELINWIKAKMKANGYERPILNTEGGYIDKIRTSYEQYPELKTDVGNDIPKIHVVAFANGVQSYLYLPLIEITTNTADLSVRGLETNDHKKLPAYNSYKTMISELDGFKTAEKIEGLSTKYAYKFTFKDKNPVYVLWDTKNSSIDFSSILDSEVKVTKVDSSTQNISSANITLSESPIYIEQI